MSKKSGKTRVAHHKKMGSRDMGSNLKRPLQSMPDWVEQALVARGLMEAYEARPPYQRNDYLSWIIRAKRRETSEKRLRQMLDELEVGGVYMKMDHPASRKQG